MTKQLLFLCVIFFLAGCASSDSWTSRDTALQLVVTAAIVGDAITTERIQYVDGVYENGPIAKAFLGSQPSTKDTVIYFGSASVFSYLIARALPAKWRPYWQGWEIAAHGIAVQRDCNNGLC